MTERHSSTSAGDRERLRTLAGRYAEVANSDEMNRRREVWRLTNRLEERTVPFQIEDNGTFFRDLLPELQCNGNVERHFEHRMLMDICNYDRIDDDRIFPPYFGIAWAIDRPSALPDYKETHADDGHGGSLGYTTNRLLADLPNSLHKLQRGEFSVDRDATLQRVESAESIFGDLLPVRTVNNSTVWAGCAMACHAVNWIGMENLFMLMMDAPESVHAFFNFEATERCDYFDWMEREGLLEPNYGEFCVGSGSCGYTDELPRRVIGPGDALRCEDLWSFQESQEATGISPDMFAEFIFPYQRRVSSRFGLVYYGCCEPVHNLYPVIKELANVRKITVSPWCDQESIAAQVGKKVVLSRKPHPMKLCAETWDPEAFKAHIRETLTISRDNFVELIFRDTCTLDGSMKERVAEACGIVRGLVDAG
jgi:hypothetical protein